MTGDGFAVELGEFFFGIPGIDLGGAAFGEDVDDGFGFGGDVGGGRGEGVEGGGGGGGWSVGGAEVGIEDGG